MIRNHASKRHDELEFSSGVDLVLYTLIGYNKFDRVHRRDLFGAHSHSMTALVNDGVYVVPIRSGISARLGLNVSYLKFKPSATWNPF